MKKFLGKNKYILILILVCILSIAPLIFIKDVPNGHDIEYHISRINGIKNNLENKDLKALIHIPFFNGYGYANGLFYSNFFLYLPSLLVYLGISVITSYKILILICTLATAFVMYFSMKKITKNNKASLIASILYVLAPYRMVDLYERGALGEVLVFIFAPLVVLGLYELFYGNYKKWWYLVLGFGGLVLSHLISFVVFLIIGFIVCLFHIKKFRQDIKRLFYLLLSTIVCMLLTSFFIFPMLEQMFTSDFVVNNETLTTNIAGTVIPIYRIILGISFKTFPGGIGLVIAIISLFYFRLSKSNDKEFKFMQLVLVVGLVSLLATTSLFPWKIFGSVLAPIQFAWRMLLPATVFFTIAIGLILHYCWQKNILKNNILIFLVIISFISPIGTMIREYTKNNSKIDTVNYEVINGEYLPYQTDRVKLFERGIVVKSKEEIDIDFEKKGLEVFVEYNNDNFNNYIELPLLYYLGYEAIDDDGKKLMIDYGDNNVIRIHIPDNKNGFVNIKYKGTIIQKVSYNISGLCLVIISILYMYKKIMNKKNSNNLVN